MVERKLLHADTAELKLTPPLLICQCAENDDIVFRGVHDSRIDWQSQTRVDDDPQQRTTPWQARTVCEKWIICEHGIHAHKDCIRSMTQLLYMRACFFAGYPSATHAVIAS